MECEWKKMRPLTKAEIDVIAGGQKVLADGQVAESEYVTWSVDMVDRVVAAVVRLLR